MYLSDISIHHFRNIRHISMALDPKFNLISGVNGSGKTSLLEAIYFLSLGRSFRASQLTRIIEHQQSQMTLFAKFHCNDEIRTIGVQRHHNGKAISKLDHETQPNQLPLTQALPIQLFNPESFSLLNTGAQERCKIIDWGAFYHQPHFVKVWQQCKHLIRQRNASLKQNYPMRYIHALNLQLVTMAEQLDQLRQAYFDLLKPEITQLLNAFGRDLVVEIDYYRGWNHEKSLAELLEKHHSQDLKLGVTHYGPHRADIRFKVHGEPAQFILSRGQQKLLICAIKLAQGKLYHQHHDTPCIYLMDDLHSELDPQALRYVFECASQTQSQVIATSIMPEHILSLCDTRPPKCFHINLGSFTK